jgi:hypothetical protein
MVMVGGSSLAGVSKRAGFCFCLVVCVFVAGAVALSYFLWTSTPTLRTSTPTLFASSSSSGGGGGGGDDGDVSAALLAAAAATVNGVSASYNVTVAAQFSPFTAAAATAATTAAATGAGPGAEEVEAAMKSAVADAFATGLEDVDILARKYMAFASLVGLYNHTS